LGIRSLVLTKIHNNADFLLFSRPDRLTPRSGRFRWCLQHIGMKQKDKAFLDMLKTRRKKKKQDKHLVVLWIIRIFATGTLDYHQK